MNQDTPALEAALERIARLERENTTLAHDLAKAIGAVDYERRFRAAAEHALKRERNRRRWLAKKAWHALRGWRRFMDCLDTSGEEETLKALAAYRRKAYREMQPELSCSSCGGGPCVNPEGDLCQRCVGENKLK